MSTKLHLSYQMPVPNSKLQALSSADRYPYALMSSQACLRMGGKIGGLLPSCPISEAFRGEEARLDIPDRLAQRWVQSLAEAPRITPTVTTIGGKVCDTYQLQEIGRLTPAGGVMGLFPGAGKTLTAAAAIHALENTGLSAKRLLIACPLNAMSSWRWYATYFTILGWEVILQSVDSLHRLALPPVGGIVIYDECHYLGSPSARRTKAALNLRLKFDAGLCLTGTLLHGGVEKTLAILDLAIPGAAWFSSRWAAGAHFHCLARKKLGARTVTAIEKPTGANKEAFFAFLGRHASVVTADSEVVQQSLIIPEQTVVTHNFGQPWRSLADESTDYARAKLSEGHTIPHAQEVAHYLCRMGNHEKAAWLIPHLLDDADPVVIFAHYTETLDALEEALKEASITYGRVDGSTADRDRVAVRDAFRAREIRIILGQVIATGIGMDGFQDCCSTSVMADHPWRADAYAQALARIHRRGQNHPSIHIDLVANQMQARVVDRLRAGGDFNAECAEWHEIKNTLAPPHALAQSSPGPTPVE